MEKLFVEHFKSLENMIDTADTRPLNKAFKNSSLHSLRENDGSFSGVKSFPEAMDILKRGYSEPLEQMKKAVLDVGKKDNPKQAKLRNDVVGFVPHVPNALMNIPQSMITRDVRPNKPKMIHLVYSFCAHSGVNKSDLIQAGIMFISLVNSLEKQGYRVKIDVLFSGISAKGTTVAYTVTVKDYGQALNLLKIAFPLVHPAMLRRISFRWLETLPDMKDTAFNGGYGRPFGSSLHNNGPKEKRFLVENGIIDKEAYYCNVYQALNASSVTDLSIKMGLK